MRPSCVHLLLALVGCKPDPLTLRPPVRAVGEGLAGIEAHTQSAERHVQGARPHSDATGNILLQAASDEHREVLSDVDEARTALDAAQVKLDELTKRLNQKSQDYAVLEARWYVVWGKRVERMLWIIGIGWLALGVASVVLGLGNPLGWGVWLGKEIVRLAPAMNVFAWVRNWLQRRRTVRVADLQPAGG